MPHYHVQFSDDFTKGTPHCSITVKSPEGAILNEYMMTMDHFVESLLSSEEWEKRQQRYLILGVKKVKRPVPRFVSPVLPKNCIRHVWLNHEKQDQVVFIEVPKSRWDIHYYDSPMKQVGFPRLIFGYRLQGAKFRSMLLLAVKDVGKIHADTELFKFPYANVSNGRVCLGGNVIPPIQEISQVATYHNLFFAAPSSNCYYSNGRNESGIQDLRELYSKMKDQDFPEEWLSPEKMTFDQFIASL
jgi:hypothetical protein